MSIPLYVAPVRAINLGQPDLQGKVRSKQVSSVYFVLTLSSLLVCFFFRRTNVFVFDVLNDTVQR